MAKIQLLSVLPSATEHRPTPRSSPPVDGPDPFALAREMGATVEDEVDPLALARELGATVEDEAAPAEAPREAELTSLDVAGRFPALRSRMLARDATPTARPAAPDAARNALPAAGVDEPAFPEPRSFLQRVADFGASLPRRLGPDVAITALKGAMSVPEAAVGLVDIVSGGRAGHALERVGFQPALAKRILNDWYSEQQQTANRSVDAAQGVLSTAIAALENPSTILHSVVESAPSMLTGGVAGRAVPFASAAVKAAAGEGLVAAGSAAESTRQASADGRLTATQSALAVATGGATSGLGLIGAKIAGRLGIDDVDTMIAAGVASPAAGRGLAARVALGAVQEGLLEELPQSVSEQVLANLAQDRPVLDGVDHAAVMGALAGAVMGGGAQVRRPASSDVIREGVGGPAATQVAEEMQAQATEPAPFGVRPAEESTPIPRETPARGLAPPQRSRLVALGYDPDAMTLVDAQDVLRADRESTAAAPPANVTGAPPMTPEGMRETVDAVTRDPELARRRAEMVAASQARDGAKLARPRGGAEVVEPSPEAQPEPETQAAEDAPTRDYLLRWMASDLREMPFQPGGVTRTMAREAEAHYRPGDDPGSRYGIGVGAGRVAGTPLQEVFAAAGVTGSRAAIAHDIERYLSGEMAKPTKAVQAALRLAPVLDAAWDGERFDWNRVSDAQMAAAGLGSRADLRSPVTLPPSDGPALVVERFLRPTDETRTAQAQDRVRQELDAVESAREAMVAEEEREAVPDDADTSFDPDTLEGEAPADTDDTIRARTGARVKADPDGYVDRYLKEFGPVLNADNASELFPEYAASAETRATRVRAVRPAASAVVERAFDRLLAQSVPPTRMRMVQFTSGGNGSGKSTTINRDGAAIVWDTTASVEVPTVRQIEKALAAGFAVQVNHVSIDPREALRRAINRAMGRSQGRTVPLTTLAASHAGARRTLMALWARYRDNPNVEINVFENAEGKGPEPRGLDWLRAQAYPEGDDLAAALRADLDAARDAGRVSEAVYRGFAAQQPDAARQPDVRPRAEAADRDGAREDSRRAAEAPVVESPADAGTPSDNPATSAPVPLSAESVAAAFGVSDEQATAVVAMVNAMGLPADRIEVVKGGTPEASALLAVGAKASVEFLDSGKALIRALTDPDVSSPVHELAHIARRWLLNRDVAPEARRGITDEDIATTEQWAGAKDGKWDVAAEEKFARGFERYLREGGPTLPSKIRGIFAKMRDWLTEVYAQIEGSAIDVEITPEMRAVFDRLVTRMERVQAEDAAKAAPAAPKRKGPPSSRPPKTLAPGAEVVAGRDGIPAAWQREATPAERRVIFTPGHVVDGYSGADTVLAYTEKDGGDWLVTVQREGEEPRTHMTNPRVVKAEYVDRAMAITGNAKPRVFIVPPAAPPKRSGPPSSKKANAEPYKPDNPFAAKAVAARANADRLNAPTAHERGMADAFPLGPGFGHGSAQTRARRVDASVNRASAAVQAEKDAHYLEAQARAFDAGEINAQGRAMSREARERSDKRANAAKKRAARIEAAKAATQGKRPWEVRRAVYADATGSLAGSARQLVESDHRQAVTSAVASGKPVPAEVLADYPDLSTTTDTLDTGETQTRLPGDVGAVRDEERAQPTEDVPEQTLQLRSEQAEPEQAGLGLDPIAGVERAAKRRLKDRGTTDVLFQSDPLPFTADDLEDLRVVAAAKVARGVTSRAAFDREMRREFGDALPLTDLFDAGRARAAALADLDIDDYFNFKRIDVSDTEKAHLRGAITETILRTGRIPKEREAWETIRAEAREMAPEVLDQLQPFQQMQAPFRAVRLIARERINTLNREIAEGRSALEGVPGDSPEALQRERVLAEKERDLQGLLDTWMRLRSEDGRNLAMHRMMVGSLEQWYDATFWLSKARQELGLPVGTQLPIDVFRALQDILNRGRHAVETGQPVEPIQLELSRYLTSLRKSTWLEIISAVRKAGLLTGPKTHARNVLGNLAFATLEELSRVPAVVVDFAVGVGTGHRTVHGISPRAIAASSREAATKGLADAQRILRTGASRDSLMRVDASRELNSGHPWLDTYVNTVFRGMGAVDRVFKSYAFRRSLEEQAALEAINLGVSPIEVLAKPSAEMLARAVADAEFATFNNPNIAAEFLSKGKAAMKRKGPTGQAAAFVIDLTVPFANTPSNILARMIDYTPVGATRAVAKAAVRRTIDGALTAEQQRLFAQGLGRGAVGSSLIYLGWMLAAAGMATGMGDDDEGRRNVRDAAGILPGAVRLGERWHQIATFSPAGNLVTLGASLYRRSTMRLRDELTRGGKLLGIAGRIALEQPMLKGLNDVIQALQRPDTYAEGAAAAMAGSFVPTLVNDVASAFDPYRRDTRPEGGFRQSLWTGVAARLPGARNLLPARTTVFGDEQPQTARAIWDPTIATVARDLTDPVLRELVARDVGLAWPRQAKGETPGDYTARIKKTGDVLNGTLGRLVASPYYRRMDDERKAEALERAIDDARRRVRPKKTGPPSARPRFQ